MSNEVQGSFTAVPRLSEVQLGGQYRSKNFIDFLERESEIERQRLAAIMQPAQEAMRQIQREQIRIWTVTPVEKIQKWNQDDDREFLATVVPDLNLPKYPDGWDEDAAKATALGAEANKLVTGYIAAIPQRYGIVLSRADETKFRQFVVMQVKVNDAAITDAMLTSCFVWCIESEIFTDYGFDENLKTPTPERTPEPKSLDEILATANPTTKDGDREIRKAVDLGLVNEYRDIVLQWHSSLATDWKIIPTDTDWKFLMDPLTGYFVQRNLSFGDPRSFDKARVMMARTNRWPGAVTAQEHCDDLLANKKITYSEYRHKYNELARIGKWTRPKSEAGL